MPDENPQESNNVDLSGLGSFDFMPAWAKGDAADHAAFRKFEGRAEDGDDRGDRRQGRPRRGEGDFQGERRRERPSRDFRNQDGDERRRPPRQRRDDARDRRQDGGFPSGSGAPPPRESRDRAPFAPRRPFIKPMDAEIRILPDQKDIGAVIRKIQSTRQAYPLKQLAYLFLDNPKSCILRISPRKPAEGEAPVEFHQCKACGWAALSQEELASHALAEHLGDYYEAEEVACDPPKGSFACIAKCGISGELIGPPNLHGYDAKIREMIRTRFPGMSEADYRSRLAMVHDQETVEAWRQSAVKKTVYRKKGVENAPALERDQAEMEFRQNVLPALLSVTETVSMTAEAALKTPIKSLFYAVRETLSRERRFPSALIFALRGAFHHRKLQFFRANDSRGPEFVSAAKPIAFEATNAIPELVTLIEAAKAAPCIPAAELVAAAAGGDASKKPVFATHLSWLVEKGYLVQYFNGLVTVADAHPRYAPPRKPRAAEPAPAQEEPPPAPAEEPPAAEEPAPPAEENQGTEE